MRSTCRRCGRVASGPRRLAPELCETCVAAVASEVHARVCDVHEALKILGNGADLSARLEQCDRILREAEALYRYEEQGILTTAPPPSSLLADFRARRKALLQEIHGGGGKPRPRRSMEC